MFIVMGSFDRVKICLRHITKTKSCQIVTGWCSTRSWAWTFGAHARYRLSISSLLIFLHVQIESTSALHVLGSPAIHPPSVKLITRTILEICVPLYTPYIEIPYFIVGLIWSWDIFKDITVQCFG